MMEDVAGKDENGNFAKFLNDTEYEIIDDEMEVIDEIIDHEQVETVTPNLPEMRRFQGRTSRDHQGECSQNFKIEHFQDFVNNQDVQPKPHTAPNKLQNMLGKDQFHEVVDNPCFYEPVSDESVSSIAFQAGSPGQEDAETIESWQSEDEDNQGDHPEAEHQWEVLKCSLVPGYVHQDIRLKAQK